MQCLGDFTFLVRRGTKIFIRNEWQDPADAIMKEFHNVIRDLASAMASINDGFVCTVTLKQNAVDTLGNRFPRWANRFLDGDVDMHALHATAESRRDLAAEYREWVRDEIDRAEELVNKSTAMEQHPFRWLAGHYARKIRLSLRKIFKAKQIERERQEARAFFGSPPDDDEKP